MNKKRWPLLKKRWPLVKIRRFDDLRLRLREGWRRSFIDIYFDKWLEGGYFLSCKRRSGMRIVKNYKAKI